MSLQAHNFGVAFEETWVFRSVDFSVEPGNRIAIVGPSGSGKSLFLKSLALLHRLTEGHLEWNGQSISGRDVPTYRAAVMYVPQRTADDDGTVEEFLAAPFSFSAHAGKTFEHDSAAQLLQGLGRDREFLNKTQRDLSGGERQIAALVRALLLNPEVLLLDEPTSAMDGLTATSAERLISRWLTGNEKRSTVWVTHDLEQAQRVSARIVRWSS